MTVTHYTSARIESHEKNIRRYCALLTTELTELERTYLHKRIAEEQAQLETLARVTSADACDAPAFGPRDRLAQSAAR